MAAEHLDEISRELTDVSAELRRISDLADGVGHSLSAALREAIVDGKSLKGVLAEIGRAFADIALKAALKPVAGLVSGAVESLFTALDPALGKVTPFAKGGVVASPSYFPMTSGLGLAGEAGPEAILPLTRGLDGRLGIAGGQPAIQVSLQVHATDARSFTASEAEIGAMLVRAVKRGLRAS